MAAWETVETWMRADHWGGVARAKVDSSRASCDGVWAKTCAELSGGVLRIEGRGARPAGVASGTDLGSERM